MNVLMMVTWYSPADAETIQAGVFHYEQSMDLKKHCNVGIYYPFDEQLQEDFTAREEKGIMTFRSKMDRKRPIYNKFKIFSDFKKIKKTFQPDVIHAHVAVGAGVYAVLLGRLHGIPVVVTEHSPASLAGYESKYLRMLAGFVYRHTKCNVCVSESSRQELIGLFPKCQFEVVYNGVISPKLHISRHQNELQYYKDGYVNVSIVAGFYSEWVKGYQFLLPAIQELVQEGLKIMLHIVGGGTYMEKYVSMAEELGIQKECIFYGACDKLKVYELLTEMDFSLSTSLVESAGVSVQEAMMIGKPMVVTKSGGANSLVTPKTAIVIEKESSKAIVDGIREMIARREEFSEEEIRAYAYENFEIGEISKKHMEIYKRII